MEPVEQPTASHQINPWFAAVFGFTFRQKELLEEANQRLNSDNDRLSFEANHDTLTGLYNRRFFDDEMSRLQAGRNYPISIVGADADGLKITNDKLGHNAGDQLLKDVAQILYLVFRKDDIIARTGGDEFNVLLPNTDRITRLQILKRLKRMIIVYNRENRTSVSISVGGATAETNETPLSMTMKDADMAMYKRKNSKKTGRSEPLKTA